MNVPTHKQVVSFLEVCRDFHFSQAASRLGIAQPQLSRSIRELEELVGVRLFVRHGRHVSLSASGEVFLREVYQLPSILGRAVEGARRAAAGESAVLRLGFVGAMMGDELLGVFERYRRQHPDTQLSLVDLAPSDLVAKVGAGELEGAFLGVRPKELPRGIKVLDWKEEALRVCLAKGHRLAGRKRLSVTDLAGETLVALSIGLAPAYRDFVDELFKAEGVQPESVRETNGAAAMASMVAAGCGVALLPASALRGMEAYIVSVPLTGKNTRLREVFVSVENEGQALAAFVKSLGG